ncbi:hypothetical protein AB4Y96_09195 [Phyllobacterium sp. TAF24]|uniref:hypothetical protein n=1 Tax=Phyllobacterium sp. TAF24 TaxID=3233068 RepID=UPI003F9ABC74
MLDYHAHVTVLNGLLAALPPMAVGDPTLAAKIAELCSTAKTEPDAAVLGSLTGLVVDHAASDGTELNLLENAADLWARGMALYDELGLARQELEKALLKPTEPNSLQLAQSAMDRVKGLSSSALEISAEVDDLHAAISPLPHLTPHPRQADVPAKDWTWRDVFLGRRTDAFVRNVFENAKTPRAKSFALGTLSSYSGNIAGSAYLGSVVGGPRRTHRYRDRLARNTVGSWLHNLLKTPSTAELAKQISFVNANGDYAYPADLADCLQKAASASWPNRDAPDWNLGLRRTVQHLTLLDKFQRLPLPEPPPLELSKSGDEGGLLSIMSGIGDAGDPLVEGGIDLDPDMTPSDPSQSDSKKKSGNACLAILAFILLIVVVLIALLIYCIGQWTTGHKCVVSDFFDALQGSEEPDPRAPNSVSQQQLTAMADPEAAGHITLELFSIQMMLWQGFDAAAAFLSVTGLIYPDELLMPSPLYQQFLTTPAATGWPHKAENSPENTYHLYPVSTTEQPTAANAQYPPNQSPVSFAVYWSYDQQRSAALIGHDLLGQIMRGDFHSQNEDLDADRGYRHPCWEVAAGTSINDTVLSVVNLPYEAE